MHVRRLSLLLPGLALLLMLLAAPVRAQLAVVTSAADSAHAASVAALRKALQTDLPDIRIDTLDWAEASRATLQGSRVIVTVGTLAARAVNQLSLAQPVLHTLLPASTYRRLPAPADDAGPVSAIWLDQPVQRQIDLIRLALPGWRRLAVLTSADSPDGGEALRAAAAERKLELRSAEVTSDTELYPALQRVLAEPAVLLATPDPRIFNTYSVQNVLLAAYHHHSPVLGLSAAYVRAGALLGLYSTPAQIGVQAAGVVRDVLQGRPLPPASAPATFEVATNHAVARSLDIELPTAAQLTAELTKLQRAAR